MYVYVRVYICIYMYMYTHTHVPLGITKLYTLYIVLNYTL